MKEAQAMFEEKEQYRQLCDSLYNEGVIKQDVDGSIIAVDDPLERESIKTKTKQKIQQSQQDESISMTPQQNFEHPILDDDKDKDKEMM